MDRVVRGSANSRRTRRSSRRPLGAKLRRVTLAAGGPRKKSGRGNFASLGPNFQIGKPTRISDCARSDIVSIGDLRHARIDLGSTSAEIGSAFDLWSSRSWRVL